MLHGRSGANWNGTRYAPVNWRSEIAGSSASAVARMVRGASLQQAARGARSPVRRRVHDRPTARRPTAEEALLVVLVEGNRASPGAGDARRGPRAIGAWRATAAAGSRRARAIAAITVIVSAAARWRMALTRSLRRDRAHAHRPYRQHERINFARDQPDSAPSRHARHGLVQPDRASARLPRLRWPCGSGSAAISSCTRRRRRASPACTTASSAS